MFTRTPREEMLYRLAVTLVLYTAGWSIKWNEAEKGYVLYAWYRSPTDIVKHASMATCCVMSLARGTAKISVRDTQSDGYHLFFPEYAPGRAARYLQEVPEGLPLQHFLREMDWYDV